MMKSASKKPNVAENDSNPSQIEASIQEQIIQQMLEGLKGKPEFPAGLLEQIQYLARKGQLQKATEVTKVIKAAPGGSNEAA